MEFDYESIRYICSEAEISGDFLTLTQTYFLEKFPTPHIEYKEITVFSKENKSIKTTQTFQSFLSKEMITLGKNTLEKIKLDSLVTENKIWARKLLFSFYHSSKVISEMDLTCRSALSHISTKVFMGDFEGRADLGYCNNHFISFSLSEKEEVSVLKRRFIKLIDNGSFFSQSIEKTKENILSYPSFRLRKLFLKHP